MKKWWLFLICIFFIYSYLVVGISEPISSSNYNLTNPTIGSSGNASSSNYALSLIEESSSGNASSTNYNTCLGFFCYPSDQSAPNVTLTIPDDSSSYTSNSVSITFNYNVTEVNTVNNCSLITNSVVNTTNSSINKSDIGKFTVVFGPGSYNWNVNCTDNSNNIGNSSKRSFTVTAPSNDVGRGSSQSGGPTSVKGGGNKESAVINNLVIDKEKIDITSVVNSVKTRKIGLYNKDQSNININVVVNKELEKIITFDESKFILGSKERKDFEFKVIAPEKAGIYTGKIIINGETVLVKIDVNTKELLFDVIITIPKEFKAIKVGGKLESQINLIPMGDEPRLDVTLNYIIKDFDERTFLIESDTFLIEDQKIIKKEFLTANFVPGDYVLAMELIYPNGVAVSSTTFKVKEKIINYKTILIILGIGIFFLILMTIIVLSSFKKLKIKRYKK